MKNECNIIRDLLPLYAENIASRETVEFVEEHLKTCEACREEYEHMKEHKPINTNALQEEINAAPLLELRRKMRVKRIQTIAVTVMIVIALLVSAFAFLTAPESITIYYASNNGAEDVCIYGGPLEDSGTISLPRLALGYYVMISIALFGILLAARIIFRKKENIKVWIECIMFYPLSYAIAHVLVVGFSFVTYSLTRDLALIIFISLLLWCGMLFAHGVIKTRREIKEILKAVDGQE